jgi:hypothetical protein
MALSQAYHGGVELEELCRTFELDVRRFLQVQTTTLAEISL